MLRAFSSAVSGMRNHMAFMDVVANNIANVNTTGYKSSRVRFVDMLYQTMHGATAPSDDPLQGGVNPAQIGAGVILSATDNIMGQGSLQLTGKSTDFAVQGEGFFILSDGSRNFYTRDGAFDVAANGLLVNPSNGMTVMGWQADESGAVDDQGPLTAIKIPFGAPVAAKATTDVSLSGNLNASAVGQQTTQIGIGGTIDTASSPVSQTVQVYDQLGLPHDVSLSYTYSGSGNTWTVSASAPSGGGTAAIASGTDAVTFDGSGNWASGTPTLQYTPPAGSSPIAVTLNVSALKQGTGSGPTVTSNDGKPVVMQTSATVYDSLGNANPVTLTFTKTDLNKWSVTNSVDPSAPATALQFNTDGSVVSATSLYNFTVPASGGASATPVAVSLASVTQSAGPGSLAVSANDGSTAGSLVSFTVGADGDVTGVFSNGTIKKLARIALGAFPNPGGLMRSGNNLWEGDPAAGDPAIGSPNTGGRGQISAGFLEQSNVDLAQQFTNMIIAQRGFQANSRVITTSDQLLQDLVNIKQ